MEERTFYLVLSDLSAVPLRDHLQHGYEEKDDFYDAVRALRDRWQGRIGECIAERNGFRRLRFHDTLGGLPDEAWLPTYMIRQTERPGYMDAIEPGPVDELEKEIDEAFGFDF